MLLNAFTSMASGMYRNSSSLEVSDSLSSSACAVTFRAVVARVDDRLSRQWQAGRASQGRP